MSFSNTNTKLSIAPLLIGGVLAILLAMLIVVLGSPQPVEAQAVKTCNANLDDTFGRGTHTTSSDVAAGTYQVWSRVGLASGSGTASYLLSIGGDGAANNHYCEQTVSTQASAPSGGNISWVWVKSKPFTWSGNAPITFEFAGNKDGVGLDCIVLRADNENLTDSGAQGCDSSYGGGNEGDPGTPGGGGCDAFDHTGDGTVDIFDAIKLLRQGEGNPGQYDHTGDGVVDIFDAIKLLRDDCAS